MAKYIEKPFLCNRRKRRHTGIPGFVPSSVSINVLRQRSRRSGQMDRILSEFSMSKSVAETSWVGIVVVKRWIQSVER